MTAQQHTRLWWASLVLVVIGTAISTYLTYVHYAGIKSVCAIAHGCEIVQTSQYSKIAGIPVALLGLIAFVAMLGALFVHREEGRLAMVLLSWTGLAFSFYLTYREIFSIKAICIWCTTVNGILVVLAVLTVLRFLLHPHEE